MVINVMILEDNENDRALIEESLIDYKIIDFKINFTSSVDQIISELRKEKYDVIILDLKVDDSFGISTFYSVKAKSNEIPIIIMSGTEDISVATEAMKNGAQDYIVKNGINYLINLPRAILYSMERKKLEVEKEKIKMDHQKFYNKIKKAAKEGKIQDILLDIANMEVEGVLK